MTPPLKIVVTGGGTIAPIDDVRHIANRSSGRLSATITEACLERGARVWHIHAPEAEVPLLREACVDLEALDFGSEVERVTALRGRWCRHHDRFHLISLAEGTAGEYAQALERVLRENSIDVAFLAMAVSDFEPTPVRGKIESAAEGLTIQCHRALKVIRSVRGWAPNSYLVGFKLLSGATEAQLIRAAEEACAVNHADLTVANDLRTVRAGRHTIHLVRPNHPTETYGPPQPIAEKLVDRVFAWVEERREPPA